MMKGNEFERILREKLDSYEEKAPDIWKDIEKGLAVRKRRLALRRVAFTAAAAAACLAAGILLFRNPVPVNPRQYPGQTAGADPAPISEQLVPFTGNNSVAAVTPGPETDRSIAGDRKAKTPEPANLQNDEPAREPVPEPAQEPVRDDAEPVNAVRAAEPEDGIRDGLLGENDLPEDFWTKDERAVAAGREHTSQISILSNLTTVASENDLFFGSAPRHSSSQSGMHGNERAFGSVEPVSSAKVKFFSPLSVGIQFKTAVAKHLYISSGLSYSYLVSQYDLLVDKQLFTGAYNQLHYLGVPLNLSWNFVETSSLGVYASVGGAVEKCISQRYVYASNTLFQKVGGVQLSASAGIGAEYWFVPRAGIYFDPSIVWFFDNSQPLSIRTQQPLQARLEIGFRFKL